MLYEELMYSIKKYEDDVEKHKFWGLETVAGKIVYARVLACLDVRYSDDDEMGGIHIIMKNPLEFKQFYDDNYDVYFENRFYPDPSYPSTIVCLPREKTINVWELTETFKTLYLESEKKFRDRLEGQNDKSTRSFDLNNFNFSGKVN